MLEEKSGQFRKLDDKKSEGEDIQIIVMQYLEASQVITDRDTLGI